MTGDAAEAVPLGTGVTPPMRRVPGEGMAPDADAAIFSGRTDR
jgi:hypothetical protein